MKFFVIAGEVSGDKLGAALIEGLLRQYPNAEIRGIGGALMLKAGLKESLFPMSDLSLMGVVEILPKVPLMLKRIAQAVAAIIGFNPDAVISVDCPEFSLRVQKKLPVSLKAKRVHMVAPSVWAWREGRAQKIAHFLDGIMCLFPFEPPYFEKYGLPAQYIGHPVMQSGLEVLEHKAALYQTLGIFCGSRKSEIEKHAEIFAQTAALYKAKNPDVKIIIPTFERFAALLQDIFGNNAEIITDEVLKKQVFERMDFALAVSGTIGLELAVAKVPHVIAYHMNSLTFALAKKLIKTPYAHLANIILQKEIVPEMIQDEVVPQRLMRELEILDGGQGELQKKAFTLLREKLTLPQNKNAADEAAAFVVKICNG